MCIRDSIYLAYNDEGLTSFRWTDPYTVTDMSDEYVFIMPFEEIKKIFKEMILKKYSDLAQAGLDLSFHIEDVYKRQGTDTDGKNQADARPDHGSAGMHRRSAGSNWPV